MNGKHPVIFAENGQIPVNLLILEGKCVILVTHSPDVVREADVVYELSRIARTKPAKA